MWATGYMATEPTSILFCERCWGTKWCLTLYRYWQFLHYLPRHWLAPCRRRPPVPMNLERDARDIHPSNFLCLLKTFVFSSLNFLMLIWLQFSYSCYYHSITSYWYSNFNIIEHSSFSVTDLIYCCYVLCYTVFLGLLPSVNNHSIITLGYKIFIYNKRAVTTIICLYFAGYVLYYLNGKLIKCVGCYIIIQLSQLQ